MNQQAIDHLPIIKCPTNMVMVDFLAALELMLETDDIFLCCKAVTVLGPKEGGYVVEEICRSIKGCTFLSGYLQIVCGVVDIEPSIRRSRGLRDEWIKKNLKHYGVEI